MARQKVYTDQTFETEDEAWKVVMEEYSVEKNYIMRNAKKAGKKVSVGVERRGNRAGSAGAKYIIVIYVG
jgi:hypothetical protein